MYDLTLTFDNGPDPDVTPRVLDVLAERGIKATFFVIGEKLADTARRGLAVRAHGEGHWIGNHTFTHSVPLGEQPDRMTAEKEIGRTQDAIGDLAHPQRWFRPFGGGGNLDTRLLKPSVVDYLTRNKHSCVLWNSIPRDWDDPDGWTGRALDQCSTRSGRRDPAAAPHHQPGAQARFEFADVQADRGLREVEGPGGGREAAEVGDGHQGAELVEIELPHQES